MIVLAIIATAAAALWSGMTVYANSMRSSPGDFMGGGLLVAAWCGVGVMWLAWWLN